MMNEFPKIETTRFVLNQFTNNDVNEIYSIMSQSEVYSRFSTNIPFPYQKEDAEFLVSLSQNGLAKNHYVLAVRLKDTNQIVGCIDLSVKPQHAKSELGFWIDEKFWNKGFATEVGKTAILFGFQQRNLKRIYATHFEENTASGKVLQKIGMTQEGILRCHTKKNDVYHNHVMYSIIN